MEDNTPELNVNIGDVIREEEKKPHQAAANQKFWTPELRAELLKAYLKHISQGYSSNSFTGIPEKRNHNGDVVAEEIPCTHKTFKTYIENYPDEFPSSLIEAAEAKRTLFWEAMGIQGTAGKLPGFNALSWKFNMMNRFKGEWKERQDVTTADEKMETTIIYKPEKVPEGAE